MKYGICQEENKETGCSLGNNNNKGLVRKTNHSQNFKQARFNPELSYSFAGRDEREKGKEGNWCQSMQGLQAAAGPVGDRTCLILVLL